MVNAASNTTSTGTGGAGASSRVLATTGAGAQARATANVQHAPHADPAVIASNARTILKLAPEVFKRETHLPLPGGMVVRMTASGDAVIIQSDADRRAGAFKGLSIARDQRDPEGTPLFTIDMDKVGHDWPAMAAWADHVKAGSDACRDNKAGFFRRLQNKALIALNSPKQLAPISVRDQDTERFRELIPIADVATQPPPTASASAAASTAALTLAGQFGVSPREPVTAAQFDSTAYKSMTAVKRVLALGGHFTLNINGAPVMVMRSHSGESYEARPAHAAKTGEASASSWIEVAENAADESVSVRYDSKPVDAAHPDAAVIAAVMAAVSTHARSLKK